MPTAKDNEKLPPVHPGEILNEDFLLPMNITQYRLAKSIGVDPRRIHGIVRGERSISAETALLLAKFFGTSAELWMGLQTQYDLEIARDRLGITEDDDHRIPVMEPERHAILPERGRSPASSRGRR